VTFLAILISVIIDKLVDTPDNWRSISPFSGLTQWLRKQMPGSGIITVILIVILPALLVGALQQLLYNLHLLLAFLFSTAALLYCIGPRAFHRAVREYVKARDAGEPDVAAHYLQELGASDSDPVQPPWRELAEKLLIRHNEGLLAILFWFIILGPMGAVIMHLAKRLHEEIPTAETTQFAYAAQRLYGILLWLPTQLALLGFAIGGSFTDTIQAWRNPFTGAADNTDQAWWSVTVNRAQLLGAGLASVQINKPAGEWELNDLRSTLSLTSRSLVVWLVLLALLTLAEIVG
jgi:membrane protein required for beta-lactamase induction